MSASSKNCPPPQTKQTREKPAASPPPPVPVFAKVPCARDQRAYALHLDGHTQRWIADKLKCTQPTVLRGIRRVNEWLAKTLPEDRGEFTGTEKLRLALARHEMLMERLNRMSLREFRRSRKTIPMKKTITMKDRLDEDGKPVKIRIEEWSKHQIGRKGFLDAAAKTSHELSVLAAGWLGQGNGSIAMAEAMDPEERDRWDRMVTLQAAQIKELEESRRVHAAERNARVSDECSVVNQPQSNAVPACISQSLMHPTPPREESATVPPAPVSKSDEKEPALNQETAQQEVTTSSGPMPCENYTDASTPQIEDSQNRYQESVGVPPSGGLQASAEAVTPAKSCREAIRRSHRKCELSRERKCPKKLELPEDHLSAIGPAQPSRFAPHPPSAKQQQFLDLNCLEAFYGGAAGGGKSEALLMAALQHVDKPGYAAIILRKDTQRLALAGGLIPRSHEWLHDHATWNGGRLQWKFPSGATLSFGYLAHPLDKYRYGSSEFQFIGFDELTEFAEEDYLFMFSRLRKAEAVKEIPLRMRSASNPGGIGHVWVKKRFVESGQRSEGRGQEERGERAEGRGQKEKSQNETLSSSCSSLTSDLSPLPSSPAFIPAHIADNPGLNQDEYRRSLAHLPPVLRERLMNGDWSVQEEGVFPQQWLRYYSVGEGSGQDQLEVRAPGGSVLFAVRESNCRRFCTIDPAGTSQDKAREGRGRPASHTVIQVWDQPRGEGSQFLFLRHSWRGRVGFEGLIRVIREIDREWEPQRLWIENDKLGEAAVDLLYPELPLETVPTCGRDKLTRAGTLIIKMEEGEILLPRLNNSWRLDFEAELLSWTGRDDQPSDQIDAAAYAAIISRENGTGVIHIQPVV